jgi:hypothetical protein
MLQTAGCRDEDGGTIAVYQHDGSGYADVLDYIEIDTSFVGSDGPAIEHVESEQLYAGLHIRETLNYIKRVMLNGKAA